MKHSCIETGIAYRLEDATPVPNIQYEFNFDIDAGPEPSRQKRHRTGGTIERRTKRVRKGPSDGGPKGQ
jgi:hypothetical protein